MQSVNTSEETLAQTKFANINRLPSHKTSHDSSSTRTRTLSRDTDPAHSTRRPSREHGKSRQEEGQTSSARNHRKEQKSGNPLTRCFRWSTQCCRSPKRKKSGKRKNGFWKRLKKRCRKKKKRTPKSELQKEGEADQLSTSTVDYPESSDTTLYEKSKRHKRTADAADTVDPAHAPHGKFADIPRDAEAAHAADPRVKEVMEKGYPDFTKSCCYMCANAMALLGAVPGPTTEKLHVSIQASGTLTDKADKSSSPMSYVRTVQSSVKVKVRNIGTDYSKARKPAKPKLKLKDFKNAISGKLPKMPKLANMRMARKPPGEKASKKPQTRTVACGTNTSSKHTNTPQCMAGRATQCVREKK
ncbi:uncharacterized protein LOC144470896 [Augochlora pura]